jgi:hypothetical protein
VAISAWTPAVDTLSFRSLRRHSVRAVPAAEHVYRVSNPIDRLKSFLAPPLPVPILRTG